MPVVGIGPQEAAAPSLLCPMQQPAQLAVVGIPIADMAEQQGAFQPVYVPIHAWRRLYSTLASTRYAQLLHPDSCVATAPEQVGLRPFDL